MSQHPHESNTVAVALPAVGQGYSAGPAGAGFCSRARKLRMTADSAKQIRNVGPEVLLTQRVEAAMSTIVVTASELGV